MTSTLTDLRERRERILELVAAKLPLKEVDDYQLPPSLPWDGWVFQAGRGSGKTAAMADYITKHVRGPACIPGVMPHKMALVAPTIGDAVESAARHPICLKTLTPSGRLQSKAGGTIFTWPGGSEIKLFGVHTKEDVERLRAGGNNCLVWAEELAAWRYLDEGYDQMQMGLRIGPHPHWVGSTTPKRRKKYVEIVGTPGIKRTYATTDDNKHLDKSVRERLYRMYGGTSKGRQELGGELLDTVKGALWTPARIDVDRMSEAGTMARVVVGVDPQGSEGVGMTGIVACGISKGICPCGQWQDRLPHAFVLTDASLDASPAGWARQALDTLRAYQGDRIVAERNFGGDMVVSTIRNLEAGAPVDLVTASRGKVQRAEPIAALYEQHRVHHVGVHPDLEDEQTTYTQEDDWSPNRLDALVWSLTALGLSEWREARIASAAGRHVL
jgi:phage terminase large subunit-like protein